MMVYLITVTTFLAIGVGVLVGQVLTTRVQLDYLQRQVDLLLRNVRTDHEPDAFHGDRKVTPMPLDTLVRRNQR